MKLLRVAVFLLIAFFGTINNILAVETIGQQISVDFSSINIKDLLRVLTEYSGKSVIISEKVTGKTNINLHKMLWREALDVVLQTHGLAKKETTNAIIIVPIDELNKNEQLNLQSAAFNLHYASADNVSKFLGSSGVLSQSGKVGAETRSNMLVVADTDSKISALKGLIKQVDVPVRQVLIEARIVSVDKKFVRDLGLEYGGKLVKFDTGKAGFAIAKLSNGAFLDLELTALESEGRGRVISSPKLLTADRQEAYIESGSEIPYQEKTKRGDTSTSFKKAVLSLKVTPEVVAEKEVNLLLQLSQDKVGQLTVNGVPAIDTRKIQTKVAVNSGETIVLGGIYEWSKSKHVVSVPVLGKIPLLGLFFKKTETKLERKELLMFVTPRIIQ